MVGACLERQGRGWSWRGWRGGWVGGWCRDGGCGRGQTWRGPTCPAAGGSPSSYSSLLASFLFIMCKLWQVVFRPGKKWRLASPYIDVTPNPIKTEFYFWWRCSTVCRYTPPVNRMLNLLGTFLSVFFTLWITINPLNASTDIEGGNKRWNGGKVYKMGEQ